MLVVYTSLTGNVQRFCEKLHLPTVKWEPQLRVIEPFVFITYTIGFGRVPKGVSEWLTEYSSLLKGVAASGNRNWGENFGAAGRTLSKEFKVPLLHVFELSGTEEDTRIVEDRINELHRTEQ